MGSIAQNELLSRGQISAKSESALVFCCPVRLNCGSRNASSVVSQAEKRSMTTLTFYGGINEIGGNKVLLEDRGHALLLDFGFPYKRHKLFYEEYLKPRSGAGLLDPLVMGLVPPLRGIYRQDLDTPDFWQKFENTPLYRSLGQV